ncbi:MAG: bifunctional phosphoglucose/phosphomannose isomerase [Nitrososphaerota archaeon]|jgi:glucose/mannose-6-phosphate isomerase|nr:bifunctional phosphoglucose/phosphomannose isomerase [Nitrososphaerota archaeon]
MDKHRLEDRESIKAIDKVGMLNYCLSMHTHYQKAANLAAGIITSYSRPVNIIITGMGGSAIGGELLKDWAKSNVCIPIEVNREYHLPVYANDETLVLVTSYTGDTEETLSSLRDAIKKKCMIYCITSGGTLMEIAEKLKIPYLQVPAGMPPRAALPYMLIPLLVFLEKIGLTSRVSAELDEAVSVIKAIEMQNAVEIPVKDSLTKTLAVNIEGFIPMIYGFGIFSSVARRLKQQINENAKMMSKWDNFPELNHNEIVGYEKSENMKNVFVAIFIRDNDEPVEIRSRIEITKELIKPAGIGIYEIWSQGRDNLAKMLSVVAVADFLSNYLAVLREIDPTPVQTIDKLKSSLKENCIREQVIKEIEKITGTTFVAHSQRF